MQTRAFTPKVVTDRVRVEDAAQHTPALFVHKRCRQALDIPLSFEMTAVILVTAVVALALILQT